MPELLSEKVAIKFGNDLLYFEDEEQVVTIYHKLNDIDKGLELEVYSVSGTFNIDDECVLHPVRVNEIKVVTKLPVVSLLFSMTRLVTEGVLERAEKGQFGDSLILDSRDILKGELTA